MVRVLFEEGERVKKAFSFHASKNVLNYHKKEDKRTAVGLYL